MQRAEAAEMIIDFDYTRTSMDASLIQLIIHPTFSSHLFNGISFVNTPFQVITRGRYQI